MTLAARQEPTFHSQGRGDDHHAVAAHPLHPIKPASHFTRFISGFQAISTLIGVPLALASGYTLYRTNFAPDATCTSLRASIVSMLDKNVDAATRRMLVKRDIEAFEANCGVVDPDAHAAFKALLAGDKPAAPVAKAPAVAKVATAKAETTKAETAKPAVTVAKETAKETVKEPMKAELRPAIVEKKAVMVAPAEAEHAAQEAPMSDTRWLDAVRQALVEQPAEPGERDVAVKAARPEPLVPNKPGEPVLQPNWSTAAPAVQPVPRGAAAPLPPTVAVVNAPATNVDPNRPVPPAPVPVAQYAHSGANSESWIAQIPFVGRMIDRVTE